MEVTETKLHGLLLIKPRVFLDDRGSFLETYNAAIFARETGITKPFVQCNESTSRRGVLRGLHLQAAPHAQAKLVRVSVGAVLDVCLDLRRESTTFGQHFSARLDALNHEMLYIPEGFAHGFVALEDDTVFSYMCSANYALHAERTVLWNDPELGINWGISNPLVSAKDSAGALFSDRSWEK